MNVLMTDAREGLSDCAIVPGKHSDLVLKLFTQLGAVALYKDAAKTMTPEAFHQHAKHESELMIQEMENKAFRKERSGDPVPRESQLLLFQEKSKEWLNDTLFNLGESFAPAQTYPADQVIKVLSLLYRCCFIALERVPTEPEAALFATKKYHDLFAK